MTTSDVFTIQMPATRRRILIALKEQGGLTADELASLLGISSVAVRRHLTNLERDQLVDHEQAQRGMGRPEDGAMQPISLHFRVSGVDMERMPSRDDMTALYLKAQ